jgi:class 3 adenylate cyclase/CHASE2 domain-containing sensor protein
VEKASSFWRRLYKSSYKRRFFILENLRLMRKSLSVALGWWESIPPKKRHGLVCAWIALGISFLFIFFWNVPFLKVLEDPLYNAAPRTLKERKPSQHIVIVLLKDTDLSNGQNLSPRLFQKLIESLNKEMAPSKAEKPRIVLLDYFYPFGNSLWDNANVFKKALQEFNGIVVFSALSVSQGGQGVATGKASFLMPNVKYAKGHPIGIANIPVGSDGKVSFVHWDYHQSHYTSNSAGGIPAFVEHGMAHWAELGVAAYMLERGKYGNTDPDDVIPSNESHFGETRQTLEPTHKITLRYPRMNGSGYLGGYFHEYSFSEVLQNKLEDNGETLLPSQALKTARTVFVGDARTMRQMLYGTPAGIVPGIYVPAVVAWDLFHKKFVYPLPAWVQYIVILFFSFLPLPFLSVPLLGRQNGRTVSSFFGGRKPSRVLGFLLLLCILLSLDFFLVRAYWAYDLALVFPAIASIASFAGISFYQTISAELEVSKTVQLLSRYLSPEVALAYQENPENLNLDGRLDIVTIIFCDVRGFTSASEKMSPEEVVEAIRAYYNAVGSVIIEKRGFLAKFIGDAIMGVFSEPHPQPDDPIRAVEAALEILKALDKLNQNWKKEGKMMWRVGIGINTGEAVWGAMGFKDKEELTIIGDAVNVASRLEELTKEYQVPILLSESTYEALGEARQRFLFKPLGKVSIRGRSKPVSIWTVSVKESMKEEA